MDGWLNCVLGMPRMAQNLSNWICHVFLLSSEYLLQFFNSSSAVGSLRIVAMKIPVSLLFVACFTQFLSNADDSSYDFLQGLGGPLFRGTLMLGNIEDMFQASIGSFCNQTSMCRSAYAHCMNNTCVCKNGFSKSTGGKCVPNSYFCPDLMGRIPKCLPKSGVKTCYVGSQSSQIFGCSKDNVSEEFCFLHPRSRTKENYSIGHCCPKPKIDSRIVVSLCPLAHEHMPSIPCSGCATTLETCVSMKHRTSRTSLTYIGQCCPLPCPTPFGNQTINVDGFCYFVKNFGEECENTAQCTTLNSICFGQTGQTKTRKCRHGSTIDAAMTQYSITKEN